MKPATNSSPRILRRGPFPQPDIRTGEDLFRLRHLDRSQWVVMGCPLKGLEFPEDTLEVLNSNADDRILCEDMLDAIAWLEKRLTSPSSLEGGETYASSAELNSETPEGRELADTVKRILKNLGRDADESISLENLANETALFSDARTNGDGVLPPSAAKSEDACSAIAAIMEVYGGQEDRTGETGIDHAIFTTFTKIAPDYLSWLLETVDDENILPFGDETSACFKIYSETLPLLNGWFDQCRLQQIAPNPDAKEIPLQAIGDGEVFDFTKPIHPEHEAAILAFHEKVLVPHFGIQAEGVLCRTEWTDIQKRFQPFARWLDRNPDLKLDSLDTSQIEALLSPDVLEEIDNLFTQDKVIAAELERMQQLRKLILFKRDLLRFAREFAALPGIYDPDEPAIFQSGTLYMAGRKFHLCVHVDNPADHAKVATESGIYLLYCEIVGADQKSHIAAAVTDGTAHGLAVGRHGLFYDRKGQEWKARVVRIAPQAISLREGVLAPFQRIGELVASQFEKISAAREKKIHESMEKGTSDSTKKTGTQPPAAQVPGIGGILAGGGVAFAALSTSFAFVATSLSKLVDKFNDTSDIFAAIGAAAGVMAGVMAGFLLAIIIPSLFIVGRKLRRRDLALLLDASGWAINPCIRLTHSLSRRLTEKRKN